MWHWLKYLCSAQVLLGESYDGAKVDMWSCGCSLYILLVGNYPFRSMADNGMSHVKRMQAMFPRIMSGDYTPIPEVSRSSAIHVERASCHASLCAA